MGNLIWLASYPKSGTTWLRAFLHNFLRPGDQPYDINHLNDFTASECSAALYRHYDPRPPSQLTAAEVQALRPRVHRDLTGAFPGPVFVKTHNAVLLVEGVPLLTPQFTAGAIYILRDPRAVAVSYSHHLGLSLDATIAFMAENGAATGNDARNVFERLASWSSHVLSWTERPNPKLHIMRYEDMIKSPTACFGAALRFLGIDPTPDRLERAVRFSDFATLQDQERRAGFVERPVGADAFFRTGTADAWRQVLSAAQIARIERDHGGQMRRFGYL